MNSADKNTEWRAGPLITNDYLEARESLRDVIIVPFDASKAKGTGYNLSPTTLVYSVNKKKLVKVHQNDKEIYVWVEPNDTVLTISKEYVITEGNVVGTFHSRVRMSADGLGNVSTTLDPNWKGKLLFAINNPTKRRIKLRIEEKSEGKTKSVGLVTMVLSWTGTKGDKSSEASLHLDNPPMRTDIWKDLSERPAGINGTQYEKFQAIIQRVTEFKAQKNERHTELQKLIDIVNEVRKGITRRDALHQIQSLTVGLEESLLQKEGDTDLKKKFVAWNDIIKSAQSLDKLRGDKFNEEEERLIRECRYLMMCDEVEQHDRYITQQIEQYWEGNGFTRSLKKWILPNLPAAVAFFIIIVLLLWGNEYSTTEKIILAMVTPLVTMIVQWVNAKWDKKNT